MGKDTTMPFNPGDPEENAQDLKSKDAKQAVVQSLETQQTGKRVCFSTRKQKKTYSKYDGTFYGLASRQKYTALFEFHI